MPRTRGRVSGARRAGQVSEGFSQCAILTLGLPVDAQTCQSLHIRPHCAFLSGQLSTRGPPQLARRAQRVHAPCLSEPEPAPAARDVRQAEEAARQRPAPGGGGRGGRPRGPRAHGADPRDGRASLREPEAHRAARGAPEFRGLPQGPGAAPGACRRTSTTTRCRRRRGRGGLQPGQRLMVLDGDELEPITAVDEKARRTARRWCGSSPPTRSSCATSRRRGQSNRLLGED